MNDQHQTEDLNAAEASSSSIQLPEPNPVTGSRHKKETLRQITLPFIAFVLFIILLGTLLFVFQGGQTKLWSEISTIFLIIPVLVFALVPLVLFGALSYLVIQIIDQLPPYARLIQGYIETANTFLQRIADLSAEPVLRLGSLTAMFRHSGKTIAKNFDKKG